MQKNYSIDADVALNSEEKAYAVMHEYLRMQARDEGFVTYVDTEEAELIASSGKSQTWRYTVRAKEVGEGAHNIRYMTTDGHITWR